MASHAMDREMHPRSSSGRDNDDGGNDAGGANEITDRAEAARLKHEGTER